MMTETKKFYKEKDFGSFNKVLIGGIIEDEVKYSHSSQNEDFYRTRIRIIRQSGVNDFVPVIVSSKIITTNFCKGSYVEIAGQIRSYNKEKENKNIPKVYVLIKSFRICDNSEKTLEQDNYIYLEGFICKPPIYKTTYHGKELTYLYIAVHRDYLVSDYIPCLAWGKVARDTSNLKIGSKIRFYGRIQSKIKVENSLENPEVDERRVLYEVSIMNMKD